MTFTLAEQRDWRAGSKHTITFVKYVVFVCLDEVYVSIDLKTKHADTGIVL